MKLMIKNGLLMLLTALALASCKKNKELLFNQPTSIYVEVYSDSTDYTFATSPDNVTTDTILIDYHIIGNASDKDREIKLIPRTGATAKPGYHYNIGPAVVKANEFSAEVPVYVYRRPGLKDSTVTVTLDLQENADFKLGYPDRLSYKITITDILKKPTIWESTWVPYFGSYSEVKFKFLLEVTGKTDWNSGPLPQDSRYLSQRAKNALLEYNQTNGALIDEFGMEVTFP